MTQDLLNLQHQLYDLCRYDIGEDNALKYNTLLWQHIQWLDTDNLNEAIIQLRKASYE